MKTKKNESLELVLNQVLEFFRDHQNETLGPSKITKGVGLYRGLNKESMEQWGLIMSQNDRLAQGFINELLNRGKIKRVKKSQLNKKGGYRYKK